MSMILDLGKKQSEIFISDNIGYVNSIITCKVPRQILLDCYSVLTRSGILKPIEDMPKEEKRNVWETAKEFAKDRLDKDQLIELVKALISLEYFLQ